MDIRDVTYVIVGAVLAMLARSGWADPCISCNYYVVNGQAITGDKNCESNPSAVTTTVDCPPSSLVNKEQRCIVEDVSYTLDTSDYRVVSRSCAYVTKAVPEACSTDDTSDIWAEYKTIKSDTSGGLVNFFSAVKSISGNFCTCKGARCNGARATQGAKWLIIVMAALVLTMVLSRRF